MDGFEWIDARQQEPPHFIAMVSGVQCSIQAESYHTAKGSRDWWRWEVKLPDGMKPHGYAESIRGIAPTRQGAERWCVGVVGQLQKQGIANE